MAALRRAAGEEGWWGRNDPLLVRLPLLQHEADPLADARQAASPLPGAEQHQQRPRVHLGRARHRLARDVQPRAPAARPSGSGVMSAAAHSHRLHSCRGRSPSHEWYDMNMSTVHMAYS